MSSFFFQTLILIFGGLSTAFVGWVALNVSKSSGKISSLEKDVKSMSESIEKLRGTELTVAGLLERIGGHSTRLNNLEHTVYGTTP